MFSTNDGRGYGLTAVDLQGYSRSLAFIMVPEALDYVEYSKNARRLEGDLREKGNRPVEVCIRRGGLCIWPIKDALPNY